LAPTLAAGLSTLGHAGCAVARDGADEVVVAGGGKLVGGAAAGVGLDGVAAGAGVVAPRKLHARA
jgi:hypothetical protein